MRKPMKNLPFVIWMLGFCAITEFSAVMKRINGVKSDLTDGQEFIVSTVVLFIWIYVGWLLYER